MKIIDAQKFGHSVGKLFNKVDRSLSFIPEKPRKAVVGVIACAASPILASAITVNAFLSKVPDDPLELEPVHNVESLPEDPSLFKWHRHDSSEEDGEWGYGSSGYGYYMDGIKIWSYDTDYDYDYDYDYDDEED